MKLRASSAPLLIICGQSRRGKIDIDEDNDAARIGSACHEAMASWIKSATMPDIEDMAKRYRIEGQEEELAMLLAYGRAAWAELSEKFPAIVVENPLSAELSEELTLTGHPDGYSLQANHVRILDWKSGRVRTNYHHQMCSYAVLCCRALGVEQAKITTVWLRDAEYETHNVQAHQLDATVDSLHRAMKSETYRTGDHCRNCPRFGECQANRQMIQGALAMVGEIGDGFTPRENADRLHVAYNGLRGAAKANDQLRRMIRHEIERTQEPILIEGGSLWLKDKCRRKLVDPRVWGPIVSDYVTQEQLAEIMGKGITALKQAVGENAEKGQKGKRIAEVMMKLESAGCIEENHFTELTLT